MVVPVARQYGFTTGEGSIDNLVDGDLSSYWAPLETNFSSYTDQFFIGDPSNRVLNYGKSFPCIELDFGSSKRITQIYLRVESGLSLGPGILIGSESPASSPANTLQTGDIFLAEYTQQQIVSNTFLDVPVMIDSDIKRRYLRLLQRSSLVSVIQPTPGPTNSWTVDLPGAGYFTVPEYSDKLTIEGWGGGGSGGLLGIGNDGTSTSVSKSGWATTPTATGGTHPTVNFPNASSGPGQGGTASGANTLNVDGNDGGVPSNFTGAQGFSGGGADAPFGGLPAPPTWLELILGIGYNFRFGLNGTIPGGGGSGRNWWLPVAHEVYFYKYPGGGSGAYFKHEILRASGDADPGSVINYVVGAGGPNLFGDGAGGNGRVRFSWT